METGDIQEVESPKVTVSDRRFDVTDSLKGVLGGMDPSIQATFMSRLLTGLDVTTRDDDVEIDLLSSVGEEELGMLGLAVMANKVAESGLRGHGRFSGDPELNMAISDALEGFFEGETCCAVVADPEDVASQVYRTLYSYFLLGNVARRERDQLVSVPEEFSRPVEPEVRYSARRKEYKIYDLEKANKVLRGAALHFLSEEDHERYEELMAMGKYLWWGRRRERYNEQLDKLVAEYMEKRAELRSLSRTLFKKSNELRDDEMALAVVLSDDPGNVEFKELKNKEYGSASEYGEDLDSLRRDKDFKEIGRVEIGGEECFVFYQKKRGRVVCWPVEVKEESYLPERRVPGYFYDFRSSAVFRRHLPDIPEVLGEECVDAMIGFFERVSSVLRVGPPPEKDDNELIETTGNRGRFVHTVKLADPIYVDDEEVPFSSLRGLFQLLFGIDMNLAQELLHSDTAAKKIWRCICDRFPVFLDKQPEGFCISESDFRNLEFRKEELEKRGVGFREDDIQTLVDIANGEIGNTLSCVELIKRVILGCAEIAGPGHKINIEWDDLGGVDRATAYTLGSVMDDCDMGRSLSLMCRGKSLGTVDPIRQFTSVPDTVGPTLTKEEGEQLSIRGLYDVIQVGSPYLSDSEGRGGVGRQIPYSSLMRPLVKLLFGVDLRSINGVKNTSGARKMIQYAEKFDPGISEKLASVCPYVADEDFSYERLSELGLVGEDVRMANLINGNLESPEECKDLVKKLLDACGEAVFVCDLSTVDVLTMELLEEYVREGGRTKIILVMSPDERSEVGEDDVEILRDGLERILDDDLEGLSEWALKVGRFPDHRQAGKLLESVVERFFGDVDGFLDYLFDSVEARDDGEFLSLDQRAEVLMALLPGFIEQAHRALGKKDLEASVVPGNVIYQAYSYFDHAIDNETGVDSGDRFAQFLKPHVCDMLMIRTLYFQVKDEGYGPDDGPVGPMKEGVEMSGRMFGANHCGLMAEAPAALYARAIIHWELREYDEVIKIAGTIVAGSEVEGSYSGEWRESVPDQYRGVDGENYCVAGFAPPYRVAEDDRGVKARLAYLGAVSAAKRCLNLKKEKNEDYKKYFQRCIELSSVFKKYINEGEHLIPAYNIAHFHFVLAELYLKLGDFYGCKEECGNVRDVLEEGDVYYESYSRRIEHFYAEMYVGAALGYFVGLKKNYDGVFNPDKVEKMKEQILTAVLTEQIIAVEESEDMTIKSELMMTRAQFLMLLNCLLDFEDILDLESTNVMFRGRKYNYSQIAHDDPVVMMKNANDESVAVAWEVFPTKPNQLIEYAEAMQGFFQHFSGFLDDEGKKEAVLECAKQWGDFAEEGRAKYED